MAKLTIEIKTTSGGMGDGWICQAAANEEYAAWLHEQLSEWSERRFPLPDWSVEIVVVPVNQTGGEQERVYGDEFAANGQSVDHEAIAAEVHDVCQELWGEFCSIAREEFPHLCE